MIKANGRAAKAPVTFLKIFITFGALWFVFYKYGAARILSVIAGADGKWLLVAALIVAVHLFVVAFRWRLVHTLLVGRSLPYGLLFGSLGRGLLLGQLLPAIVGSDAIRIAAIIRSVGMVNAARSVASDRILGVWGLMALEAATLPMVAVVIPDWQMTAALAVICFGGMAVFFVMPLWPRILPNLPFLQRFVVQAASDARLVLVSAPGIYALALSVVAHIVSVFLFAALARSLGAMISVGMCIVFIPSVLLISGLPISLGGWGLREVAVTLAFSTIGVEPATASASSILFGLTTPAMGLLAELIALAFHTISAKTSDTGVN